MSGGQRKNAWTTKDWRPEEERRGEKRRREKGGEREREREREEEGWWSSWGREKAREKREGARIGDGGSERRRSVFGTRARGVKASPREVVSGGCWCDVTA